MAKAAHTAPLPGIRELVPELNRRVNSPDRRKPKSLWATFKSWLHKRWGNWKRWVCAIFEASGIAMSAYSFFKNFGARIFLTMLGIGLFIAPIEAP